MAKMRVSFTGPAAVVHLSITQRNRWRQPPSNISFTRFYHLALEPHRINPLPAHGILDVDKPSWQPAIPPAW